MTDSEQGIVWQVPQTESGDVFVSPMSFIKFDGSSELRLGHCLVGKSSMIVKIRTGMGLLDGFGTSEMQASGRGGNSLASIY